MVFPFFALFLAKKIGLFQLRKDEKIEEIAFYLGLGYAAIMVCQMFGGLLIHYMGGGFANQEALESLALPLPILFLFVVVIAPIIEELVLRGILMGKVFGNSSLVGVLVSGLLFGWLHEPTNLASWVVYGGMGLSLSLVYFFSKRWEYALTLHLINNLLGFLILLLKMN